MKSITLNLAILCALLLVGCSGGQNFVVRLTDNPISVDGKTVQNVLVTFSEVSVHASANAGNQDAGWVSLELDSSSSIDLLLLQGAVEELLAGKSLTPGAYQQIRLTVESAQVVVDGTSNNVIIPSGVIRIPLQNLVIESDKKYGVTIDFDAQASLSFVSGNWRMSPVIQLAGVYIINDDGTKTPL